MLLQVVQRRQVAGCLARITAALDAEFAGCFLKHPSFFYHEFFLTPRPIQFFHKTVDIALLRHRFLHFLIHQPFDSVADQLQELVFRVLGMLYILKMRDVIFIGAFEVEGVLDGRVESSAVVKSGFLQIISLRNVFDVFFSCPRRQKEMIDIPPSGIGPFGTVLRINNWFLFVSSYDVLAK